MESDGDPYCVGGGCTHTGLELHSEARTSATVSTIAFGVGVVALAGAAYLLFFAPRNAER
jgi:hypothetical protein